MGTPVSSGALNLSASSAAANSDISRSAANTTLKLSFSDLLRDGFKPRAPEISPLANTRPASASTPARTPSPPETSREASRAPGDSSSPASKPPRSSEESARAQNNPAETGQAAKRPIETQDSAPPRQANAGTGKSTENSEKDSENITSRTLQPQLMDNAISPDLPATIAALLNGIAGEIVENAPGNDADPETSTRSAPTHTGHPRYSTTTDSLSTRTAVPVAMQGEAESSGTESNADGNTNTSAAFTGHASRHPASAIAPALQGQTTALDKTAVPDLITNAANALSMTPREDGVARTASSGTTTNDIAIFNPPRLPTQAAAALPQFTIPVNTGQRAWAEEIGNRVMWMLGRAESRAELILTPPLLGKVEVSIHLNGDQSTAQFFASSQSAREALEQAMPRLRELLAQAGINLGEASVNTSAEDRSQDGENTHRTGARALDAHHGDGDASVITDLNWTSLNNGLINTFA